MHCETYKLMGESKQYLINKTEAGKQKNGQREVWQIENTEK